MPPSPRSQRSVGHLHSIWHPLLAVLKAVFMTMRLYCTSNGFCRLHSSERTPLYFPHWNHTSHNGDTDMVIDVLLDFFRTSFHSPSGSDFLCLLILSLLPYSLQTSTRSASLYSDDFE